MKLTDSHCHLTMSDDGESAIARARDAGVHGFLVPATHLRDTGDAIRVAQSHPDVWAAVGFHPHEAKDCDEHALVEIDRLARAPRVVAIGEIGLDYHYERSPREVQKKAFAEHLRIALANDLPVVIHNRESSEDLLSILRRADLSGLRGVLHSFTENWEVAKGLLDLGYYLSFSGIVTFRSAEDLREVARRVPVDRVLIETDTPYLAPLPHRGKTNEPAFVKHVAEVVAGLWGMDLERVAELTTENFSRLFRVEVPG